MRKRLRVINSINGLLRLAEDNASLKGEYFPSDRMRSDAHRKAYPKMPRFERRILKDCANKLSDEVTNLGAVGAMEVLMAVGALLADNWSNGDKKEQAKEMQEYIVRAKARRTRAKKLGNL